jgi:hypothetical protein
LLPLKIEAQRQQLHGEILQGQMHMDAVLREHQHAAELAEIEHKTARRHAKADKLEAEIRIKELERALKAAGKKKKKKEEPPVDNRPEEFKRAWAMEERVRQNRSAADEQMDAIFEKARRERRNLTADEVEQIDMLRDSANAAESEVRRRAAGPL